VSDFTSSDITCHEPLRPAGQDLFDDAVLIDHWYLRYKPPALNRALDFSSSPYRRLRVRLWEWGVGWPLVHAGQDQNVVLLGHSHDGSALAEAMLFASGRSQRMGGPDQATPRRT